MSEAHGNAKRLGDGSLIGEDFEEGLGHILDLRILRNVLLSLLFLTFITVAVSRFDFGNLNLVVAVIIATVKATIVATFFMHLKFEGKTIMLYVFYPLIILSILIGGCVIDAMTKEEVHPSWLEKETPIVVIPNLHHTEEHWEEGKPGAEH